MANSAHIKKIKTSVREWNNWRINNPLIVGDFRDADLSSINLRKANLCHCDFQGANLQNTNLQQADFYCAYLRFANLSQANLFDAKLKRAYLGKSRLDFANLQYADFAAANLSAASLIGANLKFANLNRANLNSVNIKDAKLSGAIFAWTVLADIDLSEAKGLEHGIHFAPSTLGIDTLYKSKGKIPQEFLLRAGIPKNMIKDISKLASALKAAKYYSCFISYSYKNQSFANHLYDRMDKEGFRVWFAPDKIRGGRTVMEQLDKEIAQHDKLLLVLSKTSMVSGWVIYELRRAVKLQKIDGKQRLFPIRLCSMKSVQNWSHVDPDTGEDLALEIRRFHIPDFRGWTTENKFETAYKRLVADLRATEK